MWTESIGQVKYISKLCISLHDYTQTQSRIQTYKIWIELFSQIKNYITLKVSEYLSIRGDKY